jgi:hypothetical protein
VRTTGRDDGENVAIFVDVEGVVHFVDVAERGILVLAPVGVMMIM